MNATAGPGRSPARIEVVGFDADDTLWHSESYYRAAQAGLEEIVGRYVDVGDRGVHERLLATERVNVRLFGYGAKGMTLSMIESAIALTNARISAADVHRIVELGKSVLQHPVELLPGAREAVARVAADRRVVLITKGDLFHQERKVTVSGLADLFQRIEIVSEKDERSYARLLAEFGVEPRAFAMVGNSVKSDCLPVLALGGFAVHVPYPLLWDLESVDHEATHARLATAASLSEVPAVLTDWDGAASDPPARR